MEKSPKMNNNNRGVSYGGGQSSLGYLFGASADGTKKNDVVAQPSPSAAYSSPPYGIDTDIDNNATAVVRKPPTSPGGAAANTFERTLSHDSPPAGFIITSRPSTKVKSVPGGDSSLGYLFGDK